MILPSSVRAHCDTIDGPVVKSAKQALEKPDVNIVLKWVKKQYEQEVKDAFTKTLAVRVLSEQSRELADMYFFETLVRLPRAGEGAPYMGLKPAGNIEPAIAAVDEALEKDSVEQLTRNLTEKIENEIHIRFKKTIEKKNHAEDNVEAGREFVEAYVEFVHYVEKIHNDVTGANHQQHNEHEHKDVLEHKAKVKNQPN
jgi:predicted ribosome quality control (RQC) complex YloA/Tae2 family protein